MKKTSTIWLTALTGVVMQALPAWSADNGEAVPVNGPPKVVPVDVSTDAAPPASRPARVEATAQAAAAADAPAAEPGYSIYSRINVLAYGQGQKLRDSPLNPNNVLDLPKYQAAVELRPDFDIEWGRWELVLKPRAEVSWQHWDEGQHEDDSETDSEFFLNEGFVRFRPADELLLSVGRENLQWGPSVIISSSNPFNRDNGRNNPRIEQPGLDFVRAVWIPNATWSLSAIANTGKGRLGERDRISTAQLGVLDGTQTVGQDDFERSYALKLDYTGQNGYFSLVPSYRKDDQYRLGFFGGWNASEALLLYTEGSIAEDDERLFQVGGAYTLRAGPTVTLEYLRNNEGCVDKSMRQCLIDGELNSRNVLYRRDYLMAQYTDTELLRNLSMNLRVLRNLNDHSNRLVGIFEYEVGDHVQLYLVANRFTGGTSTEFGSILRYSAFVGAAYTF